MKAYTLNMNTSCESERDFAGDDLPECILALTGFFLKRGLPMDLHGSLYAELLGVIEQLRTDGYAEITCPLCGGDIQLTFGATNPACATETSDDNSQND